VIVVDSSVWIDYFNGVRNRETDILDETLSIRPVLMGDLILTEVLQGLRVERHYKLAREKLLSLQCVQIGGKDIALAAAENFRFLRARGVSVRKTIDCLIATFCISSKIALLQRDRDYLPFQKYLGLRLA
jgi:predicted nucleic acid-binding protein